MVNCDDQAEIDALWEKLAEGGEHIQCGWLTDKFGVSWQIVPRILPELLGGDAERTDRVMRAVMSMKKLDIAQMQTGVRANLKEETMTNAIQSDVLGKFVWYDQMSNDLAGAEKFYSKVVGWSLAPNTMNSQKYTLLKTGESMVGGLMPIPEDAAKMGVRPAWMGYIAVDDVKKLRRQGESRGRRDPSAADRNSQCRDLRRRRRSERRRLPVVQRRRRPGADAGSHEARLYRLARTARGRPREVTCLLFRPVRLDQGRGAARWAAWEPTKSSAPKVSSPAA